MRPCSSVRLSHTFPLTPLPRRALLELLKAAHFSHLEPSTTESAPLVVGASDPATGTKKKKKKHGLQKPPAFADCEVVFVDESGVTGNQVRFTPARSPCADLVLTFPPRQPRRSDDIADIVTSSSSFRFTALKIEDAFSTRYSSSPEPLVASTSSAALPVASSSNAPSSPSTPKQQLDELLGTLSPTSRDSLLASLRHSLLLSHARSTGASILLLGSTGTRLAVDMLSVMASGRGWSAGEEIGAEYVARRAGAGDDEGRVLVVRPLALVSLREARYLCETARLRHVDLPPAPVGRAADEKETSAKGRSIQSLVDGALPVLTLSSHSTCSRMRLLMPLVPADFILSLDASFPSTAQTVLRTAHKLGQRSSSPSLPLCALCGMPAQPAADEWRKAITIADLIGAKVALEDEARADVQLPEGKGGVRAPYAPSAAHLVVADGSTALEPMPARPQAPGPPACAAPAPDQPALAPHLCYGCLLVLQEPGSAPVVKGRARPDELVLPPFVRDALLSRLSQRGTSAPRSMDGQHGEVVGAREVHGVEAVRKELEEFLLDDEEAA